MFNNLRYKIGSALLRKACKIIAKGDIMKGMKYIEYSIRVFPTSKKKNERSVR